MAEKPFGCFQAPFDHFTHITKISQIVSKIWWIDHTILGSAKDSVLQLGQPSANLVHRFGGHFLTSSAKKKRSARTYDCNLYVLFDYAQTITIPFQKDIQETDSLGLC